MQKLEDILACYMTENRKLLEQIDDHRALSIMKGYTEKQQSLNNSVGVVLELEASILTMETTRKCQISHAETAERRMTAKPIESWEKVQTLLSICNVSRLAALSNRTPFPLMLTKINISLNTSLL